MDARSLSAKWGIPAAMVLGHKRYSYCDAEEAVLSDVSADGQWATYTGQCSCGHQYREKIEVAELKRKSRMVIENGQPVFKFEEKVKSADLEEY